MTASKITKRHQKKLCRRKMKKMKKKAMSISRLGEDLIRTILARLPVKSLDQTRFVCKQWFNIISEPYFVQQHSRFSSDYGLVVEVCPVRGCKRFLIKLKDGKVMKQILRNDVIKGGEIVACCNGLLLVRYGEYVHNPTTNQTMKLPDHTSYDMKRDSYGFSFVSATQEYKIVRLIQVKKSKLACEILVFKGHESDDQNLQWRSIEVPRMSLKKSLRYRPISVNGFMYWIDYPQRIAFTLDVGAEKFYTVPFPELMSLSKGAFIEMGSFLSFVKYREPDDLEIWILEDVYKGKWVLQRTITVHSRIIECMPLCSIDNGEVMIFRKRKILWAYNVRLDTWTKLGYASPLVFYAPYVSSIVPLKTMVEDE